MHSVPARSFHAPTNIFPLLMSALSDVNCIAFCTLNHFIHSLTLPNTNLLSVSFVIDRVSGQGNAISPCVRPSVCFHSSFLTNWPLTFIIFARFSSSGGNVVGLTSIIDGSLFSSSHFIQHCSSRKSGTCFLQLFKRIAVSLFVATISAGLPSPLAPSFLSCHRFGFAD